MEGLKKEWDSAAVMIDHDPMRPIRYGMALRYIRNLSREIRILDVGCGEGTGLFILHHEGFRNLSGVEVSGERVKRASAKLPKCVELKELSPDDPLPYDPGTFDLVVSTGVIEHTNDPDRFISEIYRVLKRNSHAVISSDCFAWRILQIAGLYKTVQPIDKAISMGKLLGKFRRHGFAVGHVDTFHLPGRGYPLFSVVKEKVTSNIDKLLGKRNDTGIELQGYDDILNSALEKSNIPVNTSHLYRLVRHLANLVDDENVFLLKKT